MRIDRVAVDLVKVPPERPVASAGAKIDSLDYVFARLYTSGGLEGLGFACMYAGTQAPALKSLMEDLAERLVGEDARHRGRLWQKLWSTTSFIGHSGLALPALCAFDLALWDLAGKAANMPVYHLVGAVRDRIPAYFSGMFLNFTMDELLEEARKVRELGFRYAKMRVGRPSVAEDVERVRAVQNELGPGVRLMVDCSRGFTAERAIRLGRQLEPFDLFWIEEPTHPDDLEGSARVAAALDTTIASGENAYSKYGVRAMIDKQAADLLMLDIQRMGGLTEMLKAAALCEAYNVPISNHVLHQASGHALCASPAAVVVEYMAWEELFDEQPRIVGGDLVMGERAGLGLSLSADAFERYRVR